jgi:uncharacterized protein (DUF2252 family)
MPPRARVPYPSVDQRRAQGQEALNRTPLSSHRRWAPAADRPDPVALLGEQNRTREADLVPVRHGRMLVSPFTLYRGAAKIMAADLEGTPTAGLQVQLCGDAHLSNFGLFASPERRLLFDLNDFDETLPGPFEYDAKRLAASFAVAGRNNGFTKADARAATRASVTAYREAMAGFATMGTMDIWYAHLAKREVSQVLHDAAADAQKTKKDAKAAKRVGKIARKEAAKARTRDSLQALSKLAELSSGQYRIVSQPPIIVPARDLEATYGIPRDDMERLLREQFRAYRATLRDDHRHLLERFQPVDMARKVVGVGSVGTLAYIVLLQGRDQDDPLFLQLKEATASVLEGHVPASRYRRHGAAGGLWTADDAGRQRHLPGLDGGEDPHHPPLLLAPAARHEALGRVETMAPTTLAFYAVPAGGRWPGPTRDRGTRSRSPPIWVRATSSTGRSPTTPSGTPTRTSRTTRRSSRRSDRDDCRHSKESEGGDAKPPPLDRQAECLARLAAALGRQ